MGFHACAGIIAAVSSSVLYNIAYNQHMSCFSYGFASPTACVLCDGDAVRNSLRVIICVVLLSVLLTQTLHTHACSTVFVCFAPVLCLSWVLFCVYARHGELLNLGTPEC
jgi:predicted neutral ceramidase superfamily lipid hydrolase